MVEEARRTNKSCQNHVKWGFGGLYATYKGDVSLCVIHKAIWDQTETKLFNGDLVALHWISSSQKRIHKMLSFRCTFGFWRALSWCWDNENNV